MGTICAPSYANVLWTISKENSHTHLSRHYHLHTSGLQTIYFLHGQAVKQIRFFLNRVKYNTPSIKFEYEISQERISFLYTEIYIKNKLHLERKQTAKPFFNKNSQFRTKFYRSSLFNVYNATELKQELQVFKCYSNLLQ